MEKGNIIKNQESPGVGVFSNESVWYLEVSSTLECLLQIELEAGTLGADSFLQRINQAPPIVPSLPPNISIDRYLSLKPPTPAPIGKEYPQPISS